MQIYTREDKVNVTTFTTHKWIFTAQFIALTDVINLVWKVTSELCEACIYIIRFKGDVNMQ